MDDFYTGELLLGGRVDRVISREIPLFQKSFKKLPTLDEGRRELNEAGQT